MPDLTDAQLDQLIKAIGLKRPRGGSHRRPVAHGSYRGARQHRYRKEPLCQPCRDAENAYQNDQYALRTGRITEAEWHARRAKDGAQ